MSATKTKTDAFGRFLAGTLTDSEVESMEECVSESICQECGNEIDNGADDCECGCHDFV